MSHLVKAVCRASLSIALCASSVLSPGQVVAPTPQTPDTSAMGPTFRLDVRRVPLDIIVTDKRGNPVRGLTKNDFTVKEDGKPQKILSFDYNDGAAVSYNPPKLPPLPPNTYVNIPSQPERGPLYILYYDMVNTPEEDQMPFRKQLLHFVDEAPSGTQIALFVNAKGLHLLQGFTSDHALLRNAIESKGPGPHIPDVFMYGRNYGRADVGGALSNLKFMSEYLDGLPGRKNLLWLASIFPIPVGPTVVGLSGATASQAPQSHSVGAQGGPQVLDLTELEAQAIKEAYAAMMRSQIALYPVSLAGVVGAEDVHSGADAMIDRQYMDTIAQATGGHAYYGDNHPDALIVKAIEQGQNYYSVSYAPTDTKYDGSERQIEVTLNKKSDDTLTYRTVYYAISDAEPEEKPRHAAEALQARFLAAKSADTLYANIEHGAPMLHDLLFSIHLSADGKPHLATEKQMQQLQDSPAFFRTRRKDNAPLRPLTPVKLQRYDIDYRVIDPQIRALEANAASPVVLEFVAAAYTDDGKLLNSILNDGSPSASKGPKTNKAVFEAVQQLEAPAGATFLRVAVRNKQDNRTGTLEVSLPLKSAPGQSAGR